MKTQPEPPARRFIESLKNPHERKRLAAALGAGPRPAAKLVTPAQLALRFALRPFVVREVIHAAAVPIRHLAGRPQIQVDEFAAALALEPSPKVVSSGFEMKEGRRLPPRRPSCSVSGLVDKPDAPVLRPYVATEKSWQL